MKPLGAPDHPGREPVVMSVPVASGEAVERLHEVFCAITDLIEEFPDDKVALYDAAEEVMNAGHEGRPAALWPGVPLDGLVMPFFGDGHD